MNDDAIVIGEIVVTKLFWKTCRVDAEIADFAVAGPDETESMDGRWR